MSYNSGACQTYYFPPCPAVQARPKGLTWPPPTPPPPPPPHPPHPLPSPTPHPPASVRDPHALTTPLDVTFGRATRTALWERRRRRRHVPSCDLFTVALWTRRARRYSRARVVTSIWCSSTDHRVHLDLSSYIVVSVAAASDPAASLDARRCCVTAALFTPSTREFTRAHASTRGVRLAIVERAGLESDGRATRSEADSHGRPVSSRYAADGGERTRTWEYCAHDRSHSL